MRKDRCRQALEAIGRAEGGDMGVWKGRPDLLWLRYLYATRQNDYNRARYSHLAGIDSRESLQYTRRTLEHLVSNARLGNDLRRQMPPRVHEGLKTIHNFIPTDDNCTNLCNGILLYK